jgi:hypothetical protein
MKEGEAAAAHARQSAASPPRCTPRPGPRDRPADKRRLPAAERRNAARRCRSRGSKSEEGELCSEGPQAACAALHGASAAAAPHLSPPSRCTLPLAAQPFSRSGSPLSRVLRCGAASSGVQRRGASASHTSTTRRLRLHPTGALGAPAVALSPCAAARSRRAAPLPSRPLRTRCRASRSLAVPMQGRRVALRTLRRPLTLTLMLALRRWPCDLCLGAARSLAACACCPRIGLHPGAQPPVRLALRLAAVRRLQVCEETPPGWDALARKVCCQRTPCLRRSKSSRRIRRPSLRSPRCRAQSAVRSSCGSSGGPSPDGTA